MAIEKSSEKEKNGEVYRHPFIRLKASTGSYDLEESFKTLRTNVEFSGESVKTVCVTSSLPGEGKSTVSYGLARAFAESGKRTLLIDGDLRKSCLRSRICDYGEPGEGLASYLVGRRKYEETVCMTSLRTLDVIFAGQFPPNPSELLGSRRFAALIERAAREYSFVLIDVPPIGSVIDAAIVARVCDGSVLVIEDGEVSYRLAQKCKAQLEAAGTPVLGCVLNGVDLSSSRYYGRYYKSYYGHYYGEK